MRDQRSAPSLGLEPRCGDPRVNRRRDMPKASKETVSETIALQGLEVQLEHLDGGYSVCFESHTADADLVGLFHGLPDDRAQLPRWGYVIRGKVGFRFSDREETYE